MCDENGRWSTGTGAVLSWKMLKAWSRRLTHLTRQSGAFIERGFAVVYESRSTLIVLLHRLGLEYHKPDLIPSKLNEDKQKHFIAEYDKEDAAIT